MGFERRIKLDRNKDAKEGRKEDPTNWEVGGVDRTNNSR